MKDGSLTQDVAFTFHDAELLSISHRRLNAELRMSFVLVDGSVRAISCEGVRAMRATDIVRQNVVSRILLSTWHRFLDREVVKKVNWANSLDDTSIQLDSSAMTQYEKNIASGVWNLLVVEPSCGAEIVVVSDSIVAVELE
ncbi:hypothetical protein [Paraburkholderia terrae]